MKDSINNLEYVVLAKSDVQTVGAAGLAFPSKNVAEVLCVHVLPEHRGQGIARKLCKHLEEVANSKGCNEIILDTWEQLVPAVRLYESLNYERYDGEIFHEIDKDAFG